MSSVVVAGNTSGSVTLDAPAVSGSTVITLPTASGTMVATDTSGNVGIGVTPSAWNAGTNAIQNSSGSLFSSSSGTSLRLYQNAYQASGGGNVYVNTSTASAYIQAAGTHSWLNAPSGTAGTAATFTQAMTLDASGRLSVGTTNSSVTAGAGVKIYSDTTDGTMGIVGATTANTSYAYHLYSTGASAFRFYIGYGGTVYATSTTITGISDQRVKENIVDLEEGLDAVMALKPRKFDWKEGKGKDIKGDRGFIAQEFETVFPDMIEEWLDPAPEGEEPYKAVNANLIPILVKSIQEQQALITSLTARLDALENK